MFGVLLRLRNVILTSAKLHIVKFAVFPHLTYCQTVWHFCCFSDARKLEQIQERALHDVYCDNKSTYEELLHRAKLPTLYTPRLQAIAIIMYKVKNALAPPYIAELFAVTNSQYHLRNHVSSYLDFGLLLMANTAWSTLAVPLGSNSIYLFDCLNHLALSKSVLNLLISQAC